jgi:hypothetical protein
VYYYLREYLQNNNLSGTVEWLTELKNLKELYYNTQMLTEKNNVYSFGVVLLEIISGRPP